MMILQFTLAGWSIYKQSTCSFLLEIPRKTKCFPFIEHMNRENFLYQPAENVLQQ
jgi:hypothetical protein